MRRLAPWAALAVTLVLAPRAARAFCGFYVDGAGTKLFNNATQVVLMRDGTRTVLAMQNNYQGPPEAFAMVVPVPVVLQKGDVKTLDRAIFDRVDALDAPRLVEYWEQDPCLVPREEPKKRATTTAIATGEIGENGVKVEAHFVVGEYDVVILSATDSTGLATWLAHEKYAIPDGAEPYLRPYVEAGSKFFVAKVDPSKVTFNDGMATLSPLRFHYDSDDFSLPVRLGLINSAGTQDLIIHVLATSGRVEVANKPNAFIPTNLDVTADTRAAIFDRAHAEHPKAVITEYAWDARSCDPCPQPPLTRGELQTLGADVIAAGDSKSFTLTRLHARYTKDDLGDDLVFAKGVPVVGGREIREADGSLAQEAQKSTANAFQGRYVIRHAWTGPITCSNPHRGIWGARTERDRDPILAKDAAPTAKAPELPPAPPPPSKGCGCHSTSDPSLAIALLLFLRRKP